MSLGGDPDADPVALAREIEATGVRALAVEADLADAGGTAIGGGAQRPPAGSGAVTKSISSSTRPSRVGSRSP
jgi:hypothetical protein